MRAAQFELLESCRQVERDGGMLLQAGQRGRVLQPGDGLAVCKHVGMYLLADLQPGVDACPPLHRPLRRRALREDPGEEIAEGRRRSRWHVRCLDVAPAVDAQVP